MSERKNSFGLPKDYFDVSSKSIFNKVEWQEEHKEFPNLLKCRNNKVFVIPKNYFQTNENKLELLAYEKVASVKKQNSFSVPIDYFEENEKQISALLKKEAKVISLFSRKIMTYVAAAVLLIALGFWCYDIYFKTPEPRDCNTLACLDKTDLLKTKTLENIDSEDLYDVVDLQKLEENLNSTKTSNVHEDLEE